VVFKATGNLLLAFAVGMAFAVAFNLLSGVLVSVFKTPPFIATLAITTIGRGVVLLYTFGQPIYQIGGFAWFGQGSIGVVPVPIIAMVIMLALTWYLLNHTRFGRALYAIGGNQEAANASGISVAKTMFVCYVINGFLVGLAGIIFMSRVNSGLPGAGVSYEFEALTAAVIGGTSFSGGIGTAMGTFAGSLIVGILNNIMNLLGVDSYIQQILKGVIIATAVVVDINTKAKRVKPAGKRD
jgi:inositol transport system permease protein